MPAMRTENQVTATIIKKYKVNLMNGEDNSSTPLSLWLVAGLN